jgi:hypothetical protein
MHHWTARIRAHGAFYHQLKFIICTKSYQLNIAMSREQENGFKNYMKGLRKAVPCIIYTVNQYTACTDDINYKNIMKFAKVRFSVIYALVLNYNPALCYYGTQRNRMDFTGKKYKCESLSRCIYLVLVQVTNHTIFVQSFRLIISTEQRGAPIFL